MTVSSQQLGVSLTRGQQGMTGLIIVLFLSRFFYVAESAAQGDTLWIVLLWFVALLAWRIVQGRSLHRRFDRFDLAVGLLVGGHLISAIIVVWTTGEKRSAINLAWEWVGIGVAWFLLRQESRRAEFRRELMIGLMATGVVVAGYGLYQHYYEFPRLTAEYGPLFDQLKQAGPVERAGLRQKFARDEIPFEGPGLTLFEKRLRDSREPVGLFALANNLGGFLSVCLMILAAVVAQVFRANRRMRARVAWIALVVIVAWCLLLTKSRTAWVGTLCGFCLWPIVTGRVALTRGRLVAAGGMIAGLSLAGWTLLQTGGLDRQVLTESLKSFQYRLQYWAASWSMIKDHVLFGVGPGQFRAHYLFYKLPEASEEISDPHNLLLDVATNGGIIAVLGLICLLGALALRIRSVRNDDAIVGARSQGQIGWIIAGLTAVVWSLLLISSFDDRLLILLPVTLIAAWWMRGTLERQLNHCCDFSIGAIPAAAALTIHLLGAGGIGMPAVTLLLLALVAIATADTATIGEISLPRSLPVMDEGRRIGKLNWRSYLLVPGCLVLIGACWVTAVQPYFLVDRGMTTGDRLAEQGELANAEAQYRSAAAADNFAVDPWRRQAELAWLKFQDKRFRSNELFLTAVNFMREAARRDPFGYQDDKRVGDWWLSNWKIAKDVDSARQAAAAYGRAWSKYPTNTFLMAELVFAVQATGSFDQETAKIASQAIHQDDINHHWNHVDRFLPLPDRQRLEKLAGNAVD